MRLLPEAAVVLRRERQETEIMVAYLQAGQLLPADMPGATAVLTWRRVMIMIQLIMEAGQEVQVAVR
jgi:hypothetical protein